MFFFFLPSTQLPLSLTRSPRSDAVLCARLCAVSVRKRVVVVASGGESRRPCATNARSSGLPNTKKTLVRELIGTFPSICAFLSGDKRNGERQIFVVIIRP